MCKGRRVAWIRTENVKEIVEKYDGEIQVQDINNIFTVSIILESTQNE